MLFTSIAIKRALFAGGLLVKLGQALYSRQVTGTVMGVAQLS
jgi:hypothetical protein